MRKYKKELLDTGPDSLKTTSKKVVHKAGKFLGNQIADVVTKSNDDKIVKQEPVEEIIIPLEKRDEILNKLRKVLKKWNTIRYLNYWTIQLYQILRQKKWIEINGLSSGQYSGNKNIKFKTSTLRSDLCDYSDAYIVVKGRVTVRGNNVNIINKKLTFKKNAPFRSCVSKISNILIDNAEDFDILVPMYNLLEYSDNYSMTSGSLWNDYRDEINDDENENDNNNNNNNNKNNNNNRLNKNKIK